MFFSVLRQYPNSATAEAKILLSARRYILLFPERTDELLLNKYFINKYQLSLKQMCLKILDACTIDCPEKGRYTITLKDKKLDNIASLITYGNGKLFGSKILRYAIQ